MKNTQSHIITLTKSCGIILMVLAHSMPPESLLRRIIYSFHMPLFFIMSGYCFKTDYLLDTKKFIYRKLKSIYLPMVLFSLPILLLHNVFCYAYIYEPTWIYTWKDFAWNILRVVTRMSHNEGMLGTFWFLKDLFVGNLIFYFAYKWINKTKLNNKYHLPVIVLILVFISELCSMFHLRVPYFGISDKSFNAAFFIAFGYLWKQKGWKTNNWFIWGIGIVSICIKLHVIPETMFQGTSYITFFGFAIPALFGSMILWDICRLMYKYLPQMIITFFEKIGHKTLWIMALHFLSFKLVSYMYLLLYELPIINLVDFPVLSICIHSPIMWLIYTAIGVFIPLVCANFFLVCKELIYHFYNSKILYKL